MTEADAAFYSCVVICITVLILTWRLWAKS